VGTFAILSQTILVLTAAVLFYVAFTDFKHYKIRNELILVLAGLFLLYASISGSWMAFVWNFGFAAILFLLMLYFYSMGLMGGGDLKLLTVAFLWVGPFCAVPFAVFLLFFVGIHSVAAKLKLVGTQIRKGHKAIAFAPSIAAALISVFLVGCLDESMRSALYASMGSWLHQLIFKLLPSIPHTG
jgi:prepilin peptidase CpaA